MSTATELESEALGKKWFYHFTLPSGNVTASYLDDAVGKIHDTRAQMMTNALGSIFGSGLSSINCADLACHEGFFSFKLAALGCKSVTGFDAREKHITDASLLKQIYGSQNINFLKADIGGGIPTSTEYDVVLMFGILYHLENPIGALRVAYKLTRTVCLIETQIAPNLSGITDWGAYTFTKEIVGCFGIVDETAELADDNQEASISPITLFPSLPGLLWILKRIGFSRAEIVPVPHDGYEQLLSGKRVMVAAYK